MIQETFAVGDSLFHRFDPRLKIVFATAYSFVVALSKRFPVLLTALVLSLLMIALARLSVREVFKRLVPVNILILLLWLAVPLTFEGEPLFHIGRFAITRPGVILSAQITLKANTILLALMALIATSSISTLGHALNHLCLPTKIVDLLLLTYRYIFVIEQEYLRLLAAMRIRSFCPGTNIHTYKTYAYLIGMLFVRASDRAERVYQAMLCRGFKGKFYSLHEFSFSRLDWVSCAFMVVAIIGLGILEWKRIM
jgi:cobalt/nickel transport system permease protein